MKEHVNIDKVIEVVRSVTLKADDEGVRSVDVECRLIECNKKQALAIEKVLPDGYSRQSAIDLKGDTDYITYKYSEYPRGVSIVIHIRDREKEKNNA